MKSKTLTYLRANWTVESIAPYENLAEILRDILDRLTDVVSTQVEKADGSNVEIRHRSFDENGNIYLHCVTYTPGVEGSLVPYATVSEIHGPLRKIPAPDNTEFLTNSLMCMISGNHVLFCSDGMSHQQLRYYFQQLMLQAKLPDDCTRLELLSVANREKLKEIIDDRAKCIGLNVTLDEFDEIDDVSSGVATKLRESFYNTISTLIAEDDSFKDIALADLTNLNASLSLSFNSRKRGKVTQSEFDKYAKDFAEDDDPGFFIELRSGSKITHKSIKLSKLVKISTDGTTINFSDAWGKLQEFYLDLIQAGQI